VVRVFRTNDFAEVATIPVGKLPHGIWPSGDGTRVYVGLENEDALTVIDTISNKVIATIPIGQAPQAVNYVPEAVPEGDGLQNLQPLGLAGEKVHLTLAPRSAGKETPAPTSVSLFDQGLIQVLQAAVTGLEPKHPYVLALSRTSDGQGALQALAAFTSNPAGAAIVNALGPIRQIVGPQADVQRRYLVIVPGTSAQPGAPVQVQTEVEQAPAERE
jgi:YVTN family beta-propeller protein